MKILYIGDTFEPSSGVFQKMMAQTGQWEATGHQVWLVTQTDLVPKRREDLVPLMMHAGSLSSPSSFPHRVSNQLRQRLFSLGAFQLSVISLGIDLVYTRELTRGVGLLPFMKTNPVIAEINGDVAKEFSGLKGLAKKYRRDLLVKSSRGVVFVSRELMNSCLPFNRPSAVIANACFAPASDSGLDRPFTQRPSLVFIGAKKRDWHGADKVQYLAKALPEFDFYMIGTNETSSNNLFSTGPLPPAQIHPILQKCHVGISSLATHRKGMSEASPLKSRQYLAAGLPIIQAYEDTDIPSDHPAVLQLPNTEHNCRDNVGRVRDFVLEAHRSLASREAALRLATGPLSIREKEKTRLDFFNQCMGRLSHD